MTKSADIVRDTAREFEAVRPEDSLSMITFADQLMVEHALGTNRQFTFDAIDKYKPAGGTALYDALWGALQQLRTVSGRRAIVVLTDGRDENNAGNGPGSGHSFEDVLELSREVGATIFPIGLGSRVDKEFLEHLATVTGGDPYFSADPGNCGTVPRDHRKPPPALRSELYVHQYETRRGLAPRADSLTRRLTDRHHQRRLLRSESLNRWLDFRNPAW